MLAISTTQEIAEFVQTEAVKCGLKPTNFHQIEYQNRAKKSFMKGKITST